MNQRDDPGQEQQGDNPGYDPLFADGFFLFRGGGMDFRPVQRDFSCLEGNGFGGAGRHALAAMDALPVADLFDIHGTNTHAPAAIGTFCRFHFDADKCKLCKQAIQRTQRRKRQNAR